MGGPILAWLMNLGFAASAIQVVEVTPRFHTIRGAHNNSATLRNTTNLSVSVRGAQNNNASLRGSEG